jgi:small conductance mechanosensitive channel
MNSSADQTAWVSWLQSQSATIVITTIAVIFYLLVALALTLLSNRIAWLIVRLTRGLAKQEDRNRQRVQTLHQLYASLVSILGMVIAFIGILRIFVDSTQLVWMVGLFSAAFGWGARGLVSDVIAGTNYIFQNTFAIGEKLEFWLTAYRVEGTVERVNLRNTHLRAPTGELMIVPNGDIGVIRNYTRAAWSGARVHFLVPIADLARAFEVLEELGSAAHSQLPTLVEPWKVLLVREEVSAQVEVTVDARFQFGTAAESRPAFVGLIFTALHDANIIVEADVEPAQT